ASPKISGRGSRPAAMAARRFSSKRPAARINAFMSPRFLRGGKRTGNDDRIHPGKRNEKAAPSLGHLRDGSHPGACGPVAQPPPRLQEGALAHGGVQPLLPVRPLLPGGAPVMPRGNAPSRKETWQRE